MSVQKYGSHQYVHAEAGGRHAWLDTLAEVFDRADQAAAADGAELDWSSVELETERDFEDQRTLTGDGAVICMTSIRFSVLGVKP